MGILDSLFGGGGTTSQVQIPGWIAGPARKNIARARRIQQMDYQPYQGLDVAAVNPQQLAAQQMNIGAAEAFGLAAPGQLQAGSGLPEPTMVNGVSGYSSFPMYQLAAQAAQKADPRAALARKSLFGNINVGRDQIGWAKKPENWQPQAPAEPAPATPSLHGAPPDAPDWTWSSFNV